MFTKQYRFIVKRGLVEEHLLGMQKVPFLISSISSEKDLRIGNMKDLCLKS